MAGQRDPGELRRNWRLVLAATLGMAMGMPTIPFYTIGVFAPIFAAEFGWPFSTIFAGLALMTVAMLLGGPFVGAVIDRNGPKTVALVSLPCLGVAYMTLAAADGSLALYFGSWALISFLGLGATSAAFTKVINGAFERRRGLALGIVLSGTGLLAFVVKPFAQALIDLAGWRVAIVAVGALPILVAAPVVLWGLADRAAPPAAGCEARRAEATGLSVRAALRSRPFWILATVFVPMSLAVAAPIPHLENILTSLRLPPAEVVQLASTLGIAIVAGRLAGGFALDRFWAPAVGAVILTAAAAAWFVLTLEPVGFPLALAAILLLGFAAGVELDLMAYLVARYLGVRRYATTYALLYGVFAVGAGFGPSVFGHVFDLTGSYSGILDLSVVLLVAGAATILFLGPYPAFGGDRQPPLTEGDPTR